MPYNLEDLSSIPQNLDKRQEGVAGHPQLQPQKRKKEAPRAICPARPDTLVSAGFGREIPSLNTVEE